MLAELSSAVPHLVASTTRPDPRHVTEVRPLDGELSSGGNPLELLQLMLRTSRGDMLWLRPDAWAMPRESQVSELVGEAMATGRRSRAIYPARALTEAPEALRVRAGLGEQVRIISEVRTRMFIFGDTHAVIPEPHRLHRRAAGARAPALDRRGADDVVRVAVGPGRADARARGREGAAATDGSSCSSS